MPMAPAYPCSHPRCPERQPCPVHHRPPTADRDRDRMVRSPWRSWYMNPSGPWRHPVWGLRAQVLADNPWCVQCQQRGLLVEATDVDHIVPHEGDWDRFRDRANLQGLCAPCHVRKTRRGE